MNFGEKVKKLREQKKISQEELAKAIGVNTRSVQRYETGESHPRYREMYKTIAEIFDVDENYLLTENEEFIKVANEMYGRRGQLQAQEILEQASGLFAGGELSEEDQIAFVHEFQSLWLDSKKRAKDKFTPNKYRKVKTEEV
ncbi:MAG: helix-turn-helix domain-containing protein [Clostridiales bacterium]|jgi:transcriptional regulator with XRE-family HTH domain|nr:helix-turn-helix domain-containing protein [Clostridiales bacterium]